MQHFIREDVGALKMVNRIKAGSCPNFYITGTSVSCIERVGLLLADHIEERQLISFRGIEKHFTIRMPYFEKQGDSEAFLKHLKNSISIARDCYDSYCGIILVEMGIEWNEHGFSPFLDEFMDFIKDNPKICFILLVPSMKQKNHTDEIFQEFSRCCIWMKIPTKTRAVQQCVSLFCRLAEKEGYEVSEEAQNILCERLKGREELKVDNSQIIQQLVKQIVFDLSIKRSAGKVIQADDIPCIAGIEEKKEKRSIGFDTRLR